MGGVLGNNQVLLSRIRFFVPPWTVAHQTPLFMEFSRQEYWSGLPFPSPGDLPNSGIEPGSPALVGGFFTTSATWEARWETSARPLQEVNRKLLSDSLLFSFKCCCLLRFGSGSLCGSPDGRKGRGGVISAIGSRSAQVSS